MQSIWGLNQLKGMPNFTENLKLITKYTHIIKQWPHILTIQMKKAFKDNINSI